MRWLAFLWVLVALALCATKTCAQNLAEPMYQLNGKDYSQEASAIQKMLYDMAGQNQALQAQINALSASASSNQYFLLGGNNIITGSNTFSGVGKTTTTVQNYLYAAPGSTVNVAGALQYGGIPIPTSISSGSWVGVTMATISIPSGYSYYIVVASFTNVSGGSKELNVYANGDFGAHYSFNGHTGNVAGEGHVACGTNSRDNYLTYINYVTNNNAVTLNYALSVGVAGGGATTLTGKTGWFDAAGYADDATFTTTYGGTAKTLNFYFATDSGACATVSTPSANGLTGTARIIPLF